MGKKSRQKKERRIRVERGEQVVQVASAPKPPADKPMPITDATFDRVVGASEVPVLVDFWAEWCGPCKALAPVLDQVAKDKAGQILILKYDTEKNRAIMQQLNVRSLPTMVLFKDGQVADVKIGYTPPDALVKWIDRAISGKKSGGLMSRLFGG